jgi:hypothetical protein
LITGVGGRGEDLVLVLKIVTWLSKVTRMAAALHVAVLERNLLSAAKDLELLSRSSARMMGTRGYGLYSKGMDFVEERRRRKTEVECVKKARRELFRGKVGT